MLIELKKGNKIYIKPKNRGKFTKYCHGKVTSECIARGKRSSDPAIRRRATFADNARHFKHKKGGKAFYDGVNILDSNKKMSKAASKLVKKHQYGGDINNPNAMGGTAFTNWLDYQLRLPELLKQREERKQQELQLEQQKQSEKFQRINSIMGTVSDFGYQALNKLLNNKSVNKVDNVAPSKTTSNQVVANNFQNGNQFTGGTSMNNYQNYFNTTLTKPTI